MKKKKRWKDLPMRERILKMARRSGYGDDFLSFLQKKDESITLNELKEEENA